MRLLPDQQRQGNLLAAPEVSQQGAVGHDARSARSRQNVGGTDSAVRCDAQHTAGRRHGRTSRRTGQHRNQGQQNAAYFAGKPTKLPKPIGVFKPHRRRRCYSSRPSEQVSSRNSGTILSPRCPISEASKGSPAGG